MNDAATISITRDDRRIARTAFLVAVASVLQVLESLLPHPVPGLRLGLANMPVLVALCDLGVAAAFEISVLRVVLSSFIMGTFLSPGFFLSFGAAVASTAVMGGLYVLSGLHPRYRFSIVGISIAGALVHNVAQLYLAWLLLIRHPGVFVFLPWLALGAVFTGWVVASVAAYVVRRIRAARADDAGKESAVPAGPGLIARGYVPGGSVLHRMAPETKIVGLFALSLTVLLFDSGRLYLALFAAYAVFAAHFPPAFGYSLGRLRRYVFLLAAAFLLPVLFHPAGGTVAARLWFVTVTAEGLRSGALFAARNLFLILISHLLVMSTPPERLTAGLGRSLSFLKAAGIDGKRVGEILSLALVSVDVFWETARAAAAGIDMRRAGGVRRLVPALGDVVAGLYVRARDTTPAAVSRRPKSLKGDHDVQSQCRQ